VFGGHTVGAQGLGLGRSHVHGDILADFVVTGKVDQRTDATTMHIAGQLVAGFKALETTDGHVFANLAHQCGAHALDRAVTEGQLAEGGHVGRGLFGDQLSQIVHESDEIIVLGHEVGLAVDFDHGADLTVSSDVQTDQAFCRNAGGSLAGLVAQLDAQNLFGTRHVAVGLGQRLLAFHHGRVGLFAQFLDHGCGNLGHDSLQFGKPHPGATGASSLHEPAPAREAWVPALARCDARRPPYSPSSSDSSTSTNSSPSAISSTTPFRACSRPSRMASAMPRAYSAMALAESSLPGMT